MVEGTGQRSISDTKGPRPQINTKLNSYKKNGL